MRWPTALPLALLTSLLPALALADEGAKAPDEPPEAAGATLRGKLLVLDLVDRGTGAELARALSDAVGSQAGRSSRELVITAEELRASLDAAALTALSGCDAEGCMQDLASAAGAERVLGGSAALVGGDVILTVVLVDALSGERLGVGQRKVSAHPALASYAARALTTQALGGAPLEEGVPVLLESDPPGARAFVDGEAVGQTPVVAAVPPGAHEATFRADGFGEQRLGFSVEDGSPLVLRAQLLKPTVRLWPLAAALGGVALLSGTGAGWAGMAAANAYDGSFGFLTPEEDSARSYLHASPADSLTLAERQQQVEQLSLAANVLWVAAAGAATAAIVLGGVDLGLWALSE